MEVKPTSQLRCLQRENERLRMERDILKKSIAIFAGTRT
jgi:transposase